MIKIQEEILIGLKFKNHNDLNINKYIFIKKQNLYNNGNKINFIRF